MIDYINQRRLLVRAYAAGIGKSAIIYPAAFLVAVGLGLIGLGLIFYLTETFHSPSSTIGWLAATWSMCYVVGCLVVRPLFDRVLPRYLIAAATGLMGLLTLGIQAAPAVAWVFVLVGCYGLAVSHFWPPLMGWLSTAVEGRALNKVVSRFNLSWCAGNIVSPYLAGWLSERDARLPLLAGSGVFLLTAVFLAIAALTLPAVRADSREPAGGSVDPAPELGRSTRLRYAAWVGLFATYFAVSVVGNIFPIAAREQLLLTKSTIGALLLMRFLFNAVAFIALGALLFWHFRGLPMLLGQVMGLGTMAALIFVRSPWLLGGLLGLFGVSLAICYANSLFHGASGSVNRAGRMAIHESVLSAGLVGGSAIGGMVYQAGGMTHLFGLCALVLIVGLGAQSVLVVWAKWRDAPAPAPPPERTADAA